MAWEDIFTCVRTCPSILLDKVFVFSQLDSNLDLLKFKYSEKATKIRKKISHFYLTSFHCKFILDFKISKYYRVSHVEYQRT